MTAASGRWRDILEALAGLHAEQLSNRHQPCPACGGRDRYRFDDRYGSGSWFCNQCGGKDHLGGGGTGMDLLMRVRRWSFRQASEEVERYLGLDPGGSGRHRPQPVNTGNCNGGKPSAGTGLPGHGSRPWRQPETPPVDASPPALDHGAIAQWCYCDAAGNQLFWIQRLCLGGKSRKAFLHRVWLDGGWHRPSRRDPFSCEWSAPRPLYGLPGLSERPEPVVLVVEGEGTTDAAARLFPDHVVISWANGTNAIAKADWQPLTGRTVMLWPDADAPGRKAMQRLAPLLAEQGCLVQLVKPPAELPQGWDLANADWTPAEAAERLQAWLMPLQADEAEGSTGHAAGDNNADGSEPRPPTSGAAPFQCLGYDSEANYYQPSSTGQILRLGRSSHTATQLVALAPLRHWETLYPSRTGVNWAAAASDLHERSAATGMFAPERIRGRGAWWDSGRTVLHLGDRLITPDGEHPITEPFSSRHIYQRLKRLHGPGGVDPLSVEDAAVIVSIANRFRWEVPASGTLLVGWVVLGPICGALPWRPHLWLTAGAGTGKSAILDRFVVPLLGDFALVVSGATTEAGLRQTICCDAVPVVFDEAESNEKGDQQRMQAILSLARVASSESSAAMLKGSPSG
ncbi:MAG: primase-helicase zinc-binding domain-containing protein [Cyanobium sp.]